MAKFRFTINPDLPESEIEEAKKLLPENLCSTGAELIKSRFESNDMRFKGEWQNLINSAKSAKIQGRKLRKSELLYSASMVFLFIYKMESYSELTESEKSLISEECFNYVKPRIIYL